MQAVQLLKDDSTDTDAYRYIYAAGLQHLSLQNTTTAASCFRTSALMEPELYNTPLFWIRLAECCFFTGDAIAIHAASTITIQDALKDDPPDLSLTAAELYLRRGEESIEINGKEGSSDGNIKLKEHIKYLKEHLRPAENS